MCLSKSNTCLDIFQMRRRYTTLTNNLLCPLYNTHTHETHHLINVTHIRTTLSPLDLWTDPTGVTELLARWTEKLAGGPQAGRSDSPPLARVMGVGRQQHLIRDHYSIECINHQSIPLQHREIVSYRNVKQINIDQFCKDVSE